MTSGYTKICDSRHIKRSRPTLRCTAKEAAPHFAVQQGKEEMKTRREKGRNKIMVYMEEGRNG
jgi:hypothetical protein